MTSADGSRSEEQDLSCLPQPDPAHPDSVFLDRDNTVCIQTLPAAAPVWVGYGDHSFGTLLIAVAPAVAGARIDRRWKVVTFRQPRRRPSVPRVIGLEFCESEEAADARRLELLRTWRPGDSVGRPVIKARARGRARRGDQ